LLPAHIVFLELIIDPACSLVFEAEPEEPDVMHRPPRSTAEALFSRRIIGVSMVQGASVLLAVLVVLALALATGQTADEARALAFTTLVLADLGLILSNRSTSKTALGVVRSRNVALWAVLAGAIILLAVVLSVESLRTVFGFAVLHVDDLLVAGGAGLLTLLWMEMWKRVRLPAHALHRAGGH
jgi:Ca2+-transporting ATPase